MADLSEMELAAGLEKAKSFTGFFTTPVFRELCKITPADIGLPNVADAYREACCKPSPWGSQNWSHQAVYTAARETGAFELHSLTERECLPLFTRNYEAICARVMAGESIDAPVQRALPSKIEPRPLPKDEAKKRVADLKALLN